MQADGSATAAVGVRMQPKLTDNPEECMFCLRIIRMLRGALSGISRGIAEGLRYLWQMCTWRPGAVVPITPAGRFGHCHALVCRDNAGRYAYILATLREPGLEPEQIPVPGEPWPNLLLRLGPTGDCMLFVAHYDKSRETPTYQGASDNSAAVSVLLTVAHDLAAHPPRRPVALLFSAAEERGCLGAHAFLAWAQRQDMILSEVINLDMLGRDRLAIRPDAVPGFAFRLPWLDRLVYDGQRLRRGSAYPHPDQALVRRLQQLAGRKLLVYRHFTARSDSGVFQAAGLPTVCISSSNIYYLGLVWEQDSDRVELLDARNLELAHWFILAVIV
ncbi:MAG: M28 family metallopeptidase [Chloroflexaceae bacterium]